MNLLFLKEEYEKLLNEKNGEFLFPIKKASKEVEPVKRLAGARHSIKKYEKEEDINDDNSVKRDSGPAATKDYIQQYTNGKKASKSEIHPSPILDREPGSSGGKKVIKTYGTGFEDFKEKIRFKLGLE